MTLSMSSSSLVNNVHRGQAIVRLAPLSHLNVAYLSPFATSWVFPTSDYYEDSVALGSSGAENVDP
jgi:hypothetical protein